MLKQFHWYIGYDPREKRAWDVCNWSLHKMWNASNAGDGPIRLVTHKISNDHVAGIGYNRPFKVVNGQFYDERDGKPFSTFFSHSRFAAVEYFKRVHRNDQAINWIGFVDCDFLFMEDPSDLIASIAFFDNMRDKSDALYCVKKDHHTPIKTKMDGVVQCPYPRKNWSSFMVINADHPKMPTIEQVNTLSGRDLHIFDWLENEHIGNIPGCWNWIGGRLGEDTTIPHAVHYTEGGPWFPNYTDVPYGLEWCLAEKDMQLYHSSMIEP